MSTPEATRAAQEIIRAKIRTMGGAMFVADIIDRETNLPALLNRLDETEIHLSAAVALAKEKIAERDQLAARVAALEALVQRISESASMSIPTHPQNHYWEEAIRLMSKP